MFRWHAERFLMLGRWKQELWKHKGEAQELYGGSCRADLSLPPRDWNAA